MGSLNIMGELCDGSGELRNRELTRAVFGASCALDERLLSDFLRCC